MWSTASLGVDGDAVATSENGPDPEPARRRHARRLTGQYFKSPPGVGSTEGLLNEHLALPLSPVAKSAATGR